MIFLSVRTDQKTMREWTVISDSSKEIYKTFLETFVGTTMFVDNNMILDITASRQTRSKLKIF